jgi:hypothetical protein
MSSPESVAEEIAELKKTGVKLSETNWGKPSEATEAIIKLGPLGGDIGNPTMEGGLPVSINGEK